MSNGSKCQHPKPNPIYSLIVSNLLKRISGIFWRNGKKTPDPFFSPGFESEDDWFDYRLENDPRFLERIEKARRSLKTGRGIRLEDVQK